MCFFIRFALKFYLLASERVYNAEQLLIRPTYCIGEESG